MRNLILPLIIGILFITGCKKQSNPKPAVKTYLLSKNSVAGGGGTRNVYTYSYDGRNRLVEFDCPNTTDLFKFTYDDNNNLLTAAEYQDLNGLGEIYKFTYKADTVTASLYDYGGASLVYTYKLKLNASGQVTSMSGAGQSLIFTYDAAGNLITQTEGSGGVTKATFDDHPNPLSMVGTKNYFMMFFFKLIITYPSTFVNNTLSLDNEHYSYTYNSDGFPTVQSMPGYSNYQTFEYIVK